MAKADVPHRWVDGESLNVCVAWCSPFASFLLLKPFGAKQKNNLYCLPVGWILFGDCWLNHFDLPFFVVVFLALSAFTNSETSHSSVTSTHCAAHICWALVCQGIAAANSLLYLDNIRPGDLPKPRQIFTAR